MSESDKNIPALYLVGTPIGNLEDITYRAVETLKSVDHIAAEDTRKTRVLLDRYGIKGKHLISHHGPKEEQSAKGLLKLLERGDSVAIVSDAGTPGISDPAGKIVRLCRGACIAVVPIPGPSAVISALCAGGVDTSAFVFEGFLPIKSGKRMTKLRELAEEPRTVALYESTHRIEKLLKQLEEVMPDRRIVVARELTKIFEEFLRGTPAEVSAQLTGKKTKGEFVVLLDRL